MLGDDPYNQTGPMRARLRELEQAAAETLRKFDALPNSRRTRVPDIAINKLRKALNG